jgi:tetratricopeptide (TPR) repeat protein
MPNPDSGVSPMKIRIISLALLLCASATAKAEGIDKAKLREAVRLPKMQYRVGFYIYTRIGITFTNDTQTIRDEIAALERELKGDVSDGERYTRLADLYNHFNEREKTRQARDRAIELLRSQIKKEPGNGRARATLALALFTEDFTEEVDSLLNRGIDLAPRDWYPLVVRGRILTERMMIRAYGTLFVAIPFTPQMPVMVNEIVADHCREDYHEALKCFDRAAELAPREADVILYRALLRYFDGAIQASTSRAAEQGKNSFAKVCEACISDFRKLAQLRADDYRSIAGVVIVEALGFAAGNEKAVAQAKSIVAAMPKGKSGPFLQNLYQLKELSKGSNRDKAARAAEMHGFLCAKFTGDFQQAIGSLRESVELVPKRVNAWEGLVAVYVRLEDSENALKESLECLKHNENPRPRLLAAGLYDRASAHK